jgi:hypothetical protein
MTKKEQIDHDKKEQVETGWSYNGFDATNDRT